LQIAKQCPDSAIFGVDMDEISIERANTQLEKEGLPNVHFVYALGGQLPQDWTEKFDFVILKDVLHDAPGVDGILTEVKRVLRSDGYGAAYDPAVSSYPQKQANDKAAQLFLPFSFFSCLPMSLSGPDGEGGGVGWGYEGRRKKIEQFGFHLIQVGDLDISTIQERIVFQK
jgi:ubiquinone/menaquinone biosynthesis C-methylase UbiE